MATSKDKKKNIHQFCSITGTDKETAKKILEAYNHNIEMAINMHVEAQECTEKEQPNSNGASSSAGNPSKSPEVRPPIPPTRGVLVDNVVTAGIRVRKRISKSVFDGFRNFEAEAKEQELRIQGESTATNQKLRTLEDLFRPPLDMMHRGSFDTARELGQCTNKWLMVNIQNVQEFPCQVLNRDIWSNPAVKSMIKEHFIFWQIYHDSEEGVRYMQFYKVLDWPYVAIIDPRTGENVVSWNKIDVASFCDLVSDFITRNPSLDGSAMPLPPPSKRQRTDSIIDASEESQLEAALKASLVETTCDLPDSTQSSTNHPSTLQSEDEENDSETFECEDSEESELTSSSSNAIKETDSKVTEIATPANIADWKEHLGLDEDSKSDIVFRFPDGTKDQLSLPSSSKLKAIFLYVESKGFSQETYELVTNFPKRQLSKLDDAMTLKEAGLLPQETVFLQAR